MTVFQFDENLNSKKLISSCNDDGMATVLRFPKRLCGKKDEVVLTELMTKPHPFVTCDRRIVTDHCKYVPDGCPGIFIISNSNSSRTMTTASARMIIENFKAQFPDWGKCSWKRAIIEISADGVWLGRIESGEILDEMHFDYADAGWRRSFVELLDVIVNE